jgi:hypothetical protein
MNSMDPPMPGALIYEYRPQITQVVEYGASADAVLSGQTPPAEGARFDFYLEGPVSGPKPKGRSGAWTTFTFAPTAAPSSTFTGRSRPRTGRRSHWKREAWRFGKKAPRSSSSREHVSLVTNHPELSWVNLIEVWARGVVDVSTGQVHVEGYGV